jgi:hypothetical protein
MAGFFPQYSGCCPLQIRQNLFGQSKRRSGYLEDPGVIFKYQFTQYFENEVLRKRPYLIEDLSHEIKLL